MSALPGYAGRLAELLPTLWRPEPEDATLLAQWLRALGGVMDDAAAQTQVVLRAHWGDTADAALWSPHFQAERRSRGLAPANVRLPQDWAELQRYAYIGDLARLASLLDLPPWRDPASLRENVEEYRQRIADLIGAYAAGLTTVEALRRLAEAALPEDMAAPLARQRAGFAIEEPVALRTRSRKLTVAGALEGDLVSPLSTWTLDEAVATPTLIFQGVAADGNTAATIGPAFERYTPGEVPAAMALALSGTLAENEALRILPARRTWLVRDGGLHSSAPETGQNAARDAAANGPWAALAALPEGNTRALACASDGSVWLMQESPSGWGVWRCDGSAFAACAAGAPAGPYHALLACCGAVFLGAEQGLFRCPLWPQDGSYLWTRVASVSGAVRALAPLADGGLLAGGDGLWHCASDGTVLEHTFAGLEVNAVLVHGDQGWCATGAALFLSQHGKTYRYEGASLSENLADWLAADAPDNTMASPLPTLRALAKTGDGSLWLATDDGLARWSVREARTTLLEAFPDVTAGPVHALHVDDRGMLWIAAEAGLLRYDGRDLAQYDFAQARWQTLGRADTVYPSDMESEARGHWRYDRAAGAWLRWDGTQGRFAKPSLAHRAAASAAVQAVAVRPAVRAERGTWDAAKGVFAASAAVPESALRMRIKPDETRIADGGLPFLPEARAGARWRYLQLDPDPQPPETGRPWWSREGQLFPPPQREAPLPGHYRAAAQDDGKFPGTDGGGMLIPGAMFVYPPSARLWVTYAVAPAVGVRLRLYRSDPAAPLDPALVERVWALIQRARAAGVPMQLAVEGEIVKETKT